MRARILALGAPLAVIAPALPTASADWGEPWAEQRGLYTFVQDFTRPPWGQKFWTLEQWQRHIDFMAFVGLNHLQLIRAPWSERPAETEAERAGEQLWRDIFSYARSRGFTTSVIFSATMHGTPANPWHLLSPNNPSHPHWQTLVSDYAHFARVYGDVVDEWHTGVEDPGGCPRCSTHPWPVFTPTEDCNPDWPCCTVEDMVALIEEARRAVLAQNPGAAIVAHTWSFNPSRCWPPTPGFESASAEFIMRMAAASPDIRVGTHGMDDGWTAQLRAALPDRELVAWPFYLFDCEFSGGITRVHFDWIQGHLRSIRDWGFTRVIAHTTFPVFVMPAIYVYAGLLHDADRSERDLISEFAGYLVEGDADCEALSTAIIELAHFWDAMIGVANWEQEAMVPIERDVPHRPRLAPEKTAHLDAARDAIRRVTAVRASSEMPMVVSPAEWVDMLRRQIEVTWSMVHLGQFLAPDAVAAAVRGRIEALPDPVSRTEAENLVAQLGDGTFLARERLADALEYQSQYWPNEPTHWQSPLGLIYVALVDIAKDTRVLGEGRLAIRGDELVFEPPEGDPIRRRLSE